MYISILHESMFVTDIFEKLFKAVLGWEVKDFYFYYGDGTYNTNLLFSNPWTVLGVTILYFSSIKGLEIYMRTRKPPHLKPLFAAHNVILSFSSLVLLILLLETLIPIIYNKVSHFGVV